jgi:signal transduction histidine kinase
MGMGQQISKYGWLIGLLLLPVWGQAQQLDSLQQALQRSSSVLEKAALHNQLTWVALHDAPETAPQYATVALAFAQEAQLPAPLLIAHLQLADVWRTQQQFSAAEEQLAVAKQLLKNTTDHKTTTHFFLVKGKVAYAQKQYEPAAEWFQKGLESCPASAVALQRNLLSYMAKTLQRSNRTAEVEPYLWARLALQTGEDSTIVFSKLGTLQARQQQYAAALYYYKQSLSLAHRRQDYERESRAALNIGNIHLIEGRWKQAIASYTSSGALKKKLGDEKGLAILHNNIAAIYKDQERYQESLEYYEKSRLYYESKGDTLELAKTWINTAVIKILLKDFEKGIELLRRALPIVNEAQDAATRLVLHINMALAYKNLEKYQLALNYLQTAEQEAHEQGDWYAKVNIANLYGHCYWALEAYGEALTAYREAWQLGQELEVLTEQHIALFGLYRTARAQGNYQASLDWLETYNSINDSIHYLQTNQQLLDLQEKYDAQQKEQQIERLQVSNRNIELENALQAKRINLLVLLGFFVGALLLLLSLFVWYRQRQQKIVLAQEKVLHKEKVNQLMDKQALHTLNAVLSAQQRERQQLAKEIHDTLGSFLATIKYQHEAGKSPTHNSTDAQYKIMEGLIEEACAEVRSIAHQMATGERLSFDLMQALEELIERIKRTQQFDIEFHYFGQGPELSQSQELLLYRILQELFSNILKHAEADQATLQINQSETEWTIVVEDNGKGFAAAAKTSGLGLKSVAERIEELQGHLEIDSHLGRGTTLVLTIPCERV